MSRIRCDWSELSPDVLRSILEGLCIEDFHRARAICSNWYSVSRTCKRRPLYPLRILFDDTSTLLFDPIEGEVHKVPEIKFYRKLVLASCSNWLLMVSFRLQFYLLNFFTRETINLPSMESSLLVQETFQTKDEWEYFINRTDINSSQKHACLWINDRTRDYVVAWSINQHYLFTYKKGDESWSSIQGTKCMYMAYYNKDYKLYVYTSDSFIKIFDLSGDCPNEIVQGNPYRNHPFRLSFLSKPKECKWKQGIAVTNSGEFLIIILRRLEDDFSNKNDKKKRRLRNQRLFHMYMLNLETCDWERADSLGSETLVFSNGFIIRAPVKDIDGLGIKSDSICFSGDDLWPSYFFYHNAKLDFNVIDLATGTVTCPYPFHAFYWKSFWFFPGYA